MCFSYIDYKVSAFKHKIHNWLREGETLLKFERKSKSSGKIFKIKFNFKFQIIKAVSQRESNPIKGLHWRTTGGGIVEKEEKVRCRMANIIVKPWRRNGKDKSQDIWQRESRSGHFL